MARWIKKGDYGIEAPNRWGDALYFVFASVEQAGRCALDLAAWTVRQDWQGKGFRQPFQIRIGLHCGPVLACMDPVNGQPTYVGTHVSRAARIEPITPPGEVYASESFAALAAAEGIRSFRCEYVGSISMAKKYGQFPTYHVRRV
jgi:class 3 adenylate cyclase